MTSQADELSNRLTTDAGLRQQIAAAYRGALDDAGIAHDELTDDELTSAVGGGGPAIIEGVDPNPEWARGR